jgi:hypothetical protein
MGSILHIERKVVSCVGKPPVENKFPSHEDAYNFSIYKDIGLVHFSIGDGNRCAPQIKY